MSVITKVCVKEADFTVSPYVPAVYEERTLYVGATLAVKTKTYQIMSDVWEDGRYALVWDASSGAPKTIDWITSGQVDASPEVLLAYRSVLFDREFKGLLAEAERTAAIPSKGDTVRVVKGRTFMNVEGPVVIAINASYRQGWRSSGEQKLAIPLSDVMVDKVMPNGKVFKNYRDLAWVWARNVIKTNKVEIDTDALAETAVWNVAQTMKSLSLK